MTKAEAVEILSTLSGDGWTGIEEFADDMVKLNVDVEELKSWVKSVNASSMKRPKDIGTPSYPCATITMPMVSYGSFGGYNIKPIGDQKFMKGDAFYLILAALEVCGMRVPDWDEERVRKFCDEIAASGNTRDERPGCDAVAGAGDIPF